jgi:hypothetical protein
MSNNLGGKETAGGVAPTGGQTALSQYTMGEGAVGNAFGFSQIPHSTNETMGASGPAAGFATNQGQQSLSNTAQQQAAINQGAQQFSSGAGNILGAIGGKGR